MLRAHENKNINKWMQQIRDTIFSTNMICVYSDVAAILNVTNFQFQVMKKACFCDILGDYTYWTMGNPQGNGVISVMEHNRHISDNYITHPFKKRNNYYSKPV